MSKASESHPISVPSVAKDFRKVTTGSPQFTTAAIRLPLAPRTHNVVASAPVNISLRNYGGILGLTLRSFNQQALIDTTPLPDDIPKVKELGASSAPLLSASYFIGARCKDYNDDYMMCKTEANGRGELECMKEGRKVTRCAASVYDAPKGVERKARG